MEMANLEPVSFSKEYNEDYSKAQDIQPDIVEASGNKYPAPGKIRTQDRNFRLGITVAITGYFTLGFYLLAIFSSIRFMQNGTAVLAYATVAVLVALVLASGVLFLVSLILNIKQTRSAHHVSKGLLLTLISIPPIALYYIALFVKALTENH